MRSGRWPEPTAEPPTNGTIWMHPAGFPTEEKALAWGEKCVKWDVLGTWEAFNGTWHLKLRARKEGK